MAKLLLICLLFTSGCTVGEALLGAGAAGLGGYLVGEHMNGSPRHETNNYYYGHRH